AHSASAAAGGSLQNYWKAIALRFLKRLLRSRQRILTSRYCGHAAGKRHLLCRQFVAHLAKHIAGWSDKDYPGFLTGFGKVRVLRQKAVARMNSVNAFAFGKRHYLVY